MFFIQIGGVVLLVLFFVWVIVGDEFGDLLNRLSDLFHPADREFRRIHRETRAYDMSEYRRDERATTRQD